MRDPQARRHHLTLLAVIGGWIHGVQVHTRYRQQHTQDWPRLALYAASAIHFGLGDAAGSSRPTTAKTVAAGVMPITVPLLLGRIRPHWAGRAFLAYFALWHAPRQIVRHRRIVAHAAALGIVHHIAEAFILDINDMRSGSHGNT